MVQDRQVRRLLKLIHTEPTQAIAADKAGMDVKTVRKYLRGPMWIGVGKKWSPFNNKVLWFLDFSPPQEPKRACRQSKRAEMRMISET